MTPDPTAGFWSRLSIRARLAIILSLALAPVLLLGALQSALMFRREAMAERAALLDATTRGADMVQARLAWDQVLLHALAPRVARGACARRLAEILPSIPDFANLIRFDPDGAVTCAARPAPADPDRARRPWFAALVGGRASIAHGDLGGAYAAEPVLLVSVPAVDVEGRSAGVLTAVIRLAGLWPAPGAWGLSSRSDIALADGQGRYLSGSRADAFPAGIGGRAGARQNSRLWLGRDLAGAHRVFTAAPVAGADLRVILGTPYRDLVNWAWLNPVSAIVLPLLAFIMALAGVWIVADREVVRWIAYLRRIAAIYAGGRYGVHPARAAWAPPEIRDLARSLTLMADTTAARDRALREGLVQKDALLREIHHRVKNNLQVISSLINLQQRALSDPAARAALSDTRQRITALALIYRALYEGPDLRKVDLRDFLDDLITQVLSGDFGEGANIATELSIDALTIDPDHLAPLALFAVEAITNARKHALGGAGGRLIVRFRVIEGAAELTISDTGRPGAPPVVVGEGVGRTLMLAFARQLRGDLKFCPEPSGGLTTRLRFPTPAAASGR